MLKGKLGAKKFFLNLLFIFGLLWSGASIYELFKNVIPFIKDFDEKMIALWFVYLPFILVALIEPIIPIFITIFLWKQIKKLGVETEQ